MRIPCLLRHLYRDDLGGCQSLAVLLAVEGAAEALHRTRAVVEEGEGEEEARAY